MKVGVELVMVVGVDVVGAVVGAVDLTGTLPTTRIYSATTMVSLVGTDPQMKEILEDHLKDMVDLVVDSVAVAVVVLPVGKMVGWNAHVGYLSVGVGLDVGEQFVEVVVPAHI